MPWYIVTFTTCLNVPQASCTLCFYARILVFLQVHASFYFYHTANCPSPSINTPISSLTDVCVCVRNIPRINYRKLCQRLRQFQSVSKQTKFNDPKQSLSHKHTPTWPCISSLYANQGGCLVTSLMVITFNHCLLEGAFWAR